VNKKNLHAHKSWKKELRQLNRIFKHLKQEKEDKRGQPQDVKKDNHTETDQIKHSFKGLFGKFRTMSATRDHQIFRDAVNRDFQYLNSRPFAIDNDARCLLLPQSVTGHALYGHSRFMDDLGRPLIFADATIESVVAVLEPGSLPFDPKTIAKRREEMLVDVFDFLKENFDKDHVRLLDKEGRGLLGVKFFDRFEVSGKELIQGFYIAAMMDSWHFRQMTNRFFQCDLRGHLFEMGGGVIHLVDLERFRLTGLRSRDLSDRPIRPEDIQKMKDYHIIINDDQTDKTRHVGALYFRQKEGSGVCDDAALIFIGKSISTDAFWGAFLADACDTYDKYIVNYRSDGMDEYMANYLYHLWYEKYHEPLIDSDVIQNIIFMAAENNYPKISFSSSHRRFVQYEDDAHNPTIVNHLHFIQKKPVEKIQLGFERFPSDEFYQILNVRAEIIKFPHW